MAEWDHLWTDPFEEIVAWFGINAQPGSPKAEVARAVLDVRLALKNEETARFAAEAASRNADAARDAVATAQASATAAKHLVLATWALVFATIVVAIVALAN